MRSRTGQCCFTDRTSQTLGPRSAESCPTFWAPSTPEQSAIQRQLLQARRSLQRIQLDLRTTEADLGQLGDRTFQLLRSAVSLGVLEGEDEAITDPSQARTLLERIIGYQVAQAGDPSNEAGARQAELLDEGTVLRRRLHELDDQIGLVRRLESEHSDATSELAIQTDRLNAINVLLPRRVNESTPASACPLCEQDLPHPDESVQSLQQLLVDLNGRLVASRGSQARRESLIESLSDSRDMLRQSLRENAADLNAAAVQNQELANGRARREQIAFLQGRVSQELQRGGQTEGGLEELRAAERRVRGQVARLEGMFEADDPTENMKRTMDGIGELITVYASALQLEGSEFPARLDPLELTVSYLRPGGRVPLSRMGSAENWVGYHLATHLAIHHWLVTHERPTPRFLMLDQPTQAFFPEEVVDAAEDEDADWAAVRRQFELLRDVVETLSGGAPNHCLRSCKPGG